MDTADLGARCAKLVFVSYCGVVNLSFKQLNWLASLRFLATNQILQLGGKWKIGWRQNVRTALSPRRAYRNFSLPPGWAVSRPNCRVERNRIPASTGFREYRRSLSHILLEASFKDGEGLIFKVFWTHVSANGYWFQRGSKTELMVCMRCNNSDFTHFPDISFGFLDIFQKKTKKNFCPSVLLCL